jgi:hypothetical protein
MALKRRMTTQVNFTARASSLVIAKQTFPYDSRTQTQLWKQFYAFNDIHTFYSFEKKKT